MTDVEQTAGWTAGGMTVTMMGNRAPLADSLIVDTNHRTRVMLTEQQARSLRDWLDWWCQGNGDVPPLVSTEPVRQTVQEQVIALRELSSAPDTTEQFRSGLAWGERALRAISAVLS